jgi:DNA helicase IV
MKRKLSRVDLLQARKPWYFRTLFRIKGVESSGSHLSIIGSESPPLPIDQLSDFLKYKPRPWGGTISIQGTRIKNIGFLKKAEAQRFVSQINKFIAPLIGEQIASHAKDFRRLAEDTYLRDSSIEKLQNSTEECLLRYKKSKPLWSQHLPSTALSTLEKLSGLSPLSDHVDQLRENYIAMAMSRDKLFFDQVEGNPLTDKQRLACLRNNDRNMVLAAAGTGKTSVIVAKAIHLIESRQATASDILILAYNRAAAEELQERFTARCNAAGISLASLPDIKTFHALGREILKASGGDAYLSVLAEDEKKFLMWVTNWLRKYILSSPKAIADFLKILYEPVDPFSFTTVEKYEAYVRDNELRTLSGDRVKSYQELIIANWLYKNSIAFEYEPQYRKKRRIEVGVDYRPDFYLSDIDVYLEHFGIDRAGNVRPGMDKEKYAVEMELKRDLHKEQGTVLLETFHYNWCEDNLEARLEEQIKLAGGEVNPISDEELFVALEESGQISEKSQILLDCLKAIRIEGLSNDEILGRLTERGVGNREIWATILTRLHDDYRTELAEQNAIDFEDMISTATRRTQIQEFEPKWRHILVDEFQDISQSRADFLNSLVAAQTNPSLTVVGDDWQSIYRFSGGKLELTTRFDEKMGPNTRTVLDKTFRYNDSIAHIAGTFVMENPEQFQKEIETETKTMEPQVYLLDQGGVGGSDVPQKVEKVINTIRKNDPNGSIALLARYNYILNNCRAHNQHNGIRNVNYWTFHGSKGLETDYGICVGFFKGASGFPNYKLNDVVKEALLPLPDTFEHSEERRLLYVALTRARNKSYIIADAMSPSEFIIELLSPKYGLNIASEKFEQTYRQIFKCPKCSEGFFQLRKGKFGEFYSCSTGVSCNANPRKCSKCGAPSVDGRHESRCNNVECQHSMKICTVCGRPMRLREGRFGKFWGCSGYGLKEDRCKNTERFRT